MQKRVILSAGGTGGHLFPAQAVAQSLLPEAHVLFVGGGLQTNPFFDRERFAFRQISTASLSLRHPLSLIPNLGKILHGTYTAWKTLCEFSPDLVIGFGSFHSLPVLLAATLRRIPFVLHEQNVKPGRVNRLFARKAKATAITFPETAHELKGKTCLVQFPIREHPPADPWSYFGWKPGKKTLLICGGSQGAKRLNQLAPHTHGYRILHIVGKHGDADHLAKQYRMHGVTAIVKAFEPRLDLALRLADLAIARAGAGMICELIASLTPAILIPFPQAQDNHQWYNARFFVCEAGGGVMINEHDLDDKALHLAISTLNLESCRENLRSFQAKQHLADCKSFIFGYL